MNGMKAKKVIVPATNTERTSKDDASEVVIEIMGADGRKSAQRLANWTEG